VLSSSKARPQPGRLEQFTLAAICARGACEFADTFSSAETTRRRSSALPLSVAGQSGPNIYELHAISTRGDKTIVGGSKILPTDTPFPLPELGLFVTSRCATIGVDPAALFATAGKQSAEFNLRERFGGPS
jgi:hypothetical protein